MTINSLDILLSRFGISLLFHVQFWCFLTCIQISQEAVRWSGIPISFRIFQFVVIQTVKGLGTVNKAEIDVFLEFPCFLHDPVNIGNLISGFSAFSKCSLYIWKFLVHIMLKPSLKDFEHNLTCMWNEPSCLNILWHCPSLELEWKLTFASPVATAEFSKFAGVLSAAL